MYDADCLMAERLAAAGINAFSDRRLTWLGDVTGRAVQLSKLREINLFETVQNRHRAFFLKLVKHYAAKDPQSQYFRYAVITAGQRIEAGAQLSATKRAMMAKISAWHREIKSRWDIEVLLNCAEMPFSKTGPKTLLGELKSFKDAERHTPSVDQAEDQAAQAPSFHLHFNILYVPRRPLKKFSEWTEFLDFTREFFGTWWRDLGRVEKHEELIKYVLKSVERSSLTDDQCVWLHREFYRQRFIVAYNSLRRLKMQMAKDRQKLGYVAMDEAGKKRLVVVQMDPMQPKEEPRKKTDKQLTDEAEQRDRDRKKKTKFENLVRGRTGPMAKITAWAEPGTLIENYAPKPFTVAGRLALDGLKPRQARSREHWDENGAPPPELALAVSDAWINAGDDHTAAKIVPFLARQDLVSTFKRKILDMAAGVVLGGRSYVDTDSDAAIYAMQEGFAPEKGQDALMQACCELDDIDAANKLKPFVLCWSNPLTIPDKKQCAVPAPRAAFIVHTTELTLSETGQPEAVWGQPRDGPCSDFSETEFSDKSEQEIRTIFLWKGEAQSLAQRGVFAMLENRGLRVIERPEEDENDLRTWPAGSYEQLKRHFVYCSFGSEANRENFPHVVLTRSKEWLDLKSGEIFPIDHVFKVDNGS